MPNIIKPQPRQEQFLSSIADIVIFGGAAGGGKTYALLMEQLRHSGNPRFNSVIFRRNNTQIFTNGGLWDSAMGFLPQFNAIPKKTPNPQFVFPSGAKVSFGHLERYEDCLGWQGSQIPLICCEESTLIRMADGSKKPLSDIQIGDMVETLQGPMPVTVVGKRRLEDCVEIENEYGEKQIHSTTHKILTSDGWISYNDIIQNHEDNCNNSSEPNECYFFQQCDEQKHQKFQVHLKHQRKSNSHQKQIDELSLQEQGYHGEFAPCEHTLNGPHQLLTSVPTECYDVCKHAEYFGRKCQVSLLPHDNQYCYQQQEVEPYQPNYQDRGSLETSAYKVQRDLESCCELFLDNNQEPLQQISNLHLQEHQQQSHEKEVDILTHVQSFCELPCVLFGSKFGDLRGHCFEGLSQCGVPVHLTEDNDRGDVLILDGVVVQSRKDLLSDDPGKVQKYIHHKLRYVHPYTGEEQIAEGVDIEYHSCKITPLGKRWVIDLTVSTTNHYITESGLINKNCFDELTHFNEDVFWYMFSRNRSDSGVPGYIRATTNPDPDSWVAKFISWWINQETGYAIPERSGKIRWFIRINGEVIWGDKRMDLLKRQFDGEIKEVNKKHKHPDELFLKDSETGELYIHEQGECGVLYVCTETKQFYQWNGTEYVDLITPKSATFILSMLSDNAILMRNDPSYLANLKSLPLVEQERLLGGNWKIRPAAGMYFPRNKANLLDEIPNDVKQWVRAWDLAGTEDKKNNNPEDGPAYTAGVLIGKRKNGRIVIADVINRRMNSSDVRNTVLNTAKTDKAAYKRVRIRMNQDPGQAGKDQAEQYLKLLSGFSVNIERESGSKETRAEPLSAQWIGLKAAEKGNVDVVLGPWTDAYLAQMEGFPDRTFKDMVDASNTGFLELEKHGNASAPPSETGNKKSSYWTH